MTKIFKNYSVVDETSLLPETEMHAFTIDKARILSHVYEGEDVLCLSLKKNSDNFSCHYGLMGNEIKNQFMSDMKVGGIEELLGRIIIGFVNKDEEILQGLSILYKAPILLNPLYDISKN